MPPAGGESSEPGPTTRTVLLVGVPLDLFRRAQRHSDDVLRELALMRPDAEEMVALAALRTDASVQAYDAEQRGDKELTLRLELPPDAAEAAEQWASLMTQLAELCRAGVMLSAPPDDDVVAFQQWYVGEVVRQVRSGLPPRPWAG